jgi:hypothetical protein
MNAERLHAIARAVQRDLESTQVISLIVQLRDAMNALSANQADENAQRVMHDLRENLSASLGAAESTRFPPSWRGQLDELGLMRVTAPQIAERIESAFAGNELAPSVIRDDLTALADELTQAQESLNELLVGLVWLGVPEETLPPGEAEVSVLVPRAAVDNSLEGLGKEFSQLNRTLQPFVELATGSRPPLEIRTISSSDFGLYLRAVPEAAKLVAQTVVYLYIAWEGVMRFRRARDELAPDFEDDDLGFLDRKIESDIEQKIQERAEELIANEAHDSIDGERRNELKQDLVFAMNGLSNRIEQGFRVEINVGPPPEIEVDGDELTEAPATQADIAELRNTLLELNQQLRNLEALPGGAPELRLPESTEDLDGGEVSDDN